jgi:hypothetical protein
VRVFFFPMFSGGPKSQNHTVKMAADALPMDSQRGTTSTARHMAANPKKYNVIQGPPTHDTDRDARNDMKNPSQQPSKRTSSPDTRYPSCTEGISKYELCKL